MKENSKNDPTGETAASLFAVDEAMQYESAAEFEKLLGDFRCEYEPDSATRHFLTSSLALHSWRTRRLARAETGLFGALAEEVCQTERNFDRYNPPIKGTAQEMRAWQTRMLGKAFRRDAAETNALSKIARAETAVEGLFYRALQQIEARKPSRKLKAA